MFLAIVCTFQLWILVSSDRYASWEPDLNGGHSREFQDINLPIDWNDVLGEDEEFGENLIAFRQRRDLTEIHIPDIEIKDFIRSHRNTYEALQNHFLHKFSRKWMNITSRIKSFESLKKKLALKNYTLDNINDVIGFRFTLSTVSEVLDMKRELEEDSLAGFDILQIRCYGICPDVPRFKKGGYRRIHVLIRFLSTNRTAEIQLGTPYTNFWADWTHDFVYKGDYGSDSSVTHYLEAVADYLFRLDEQRDELPPCPEVLQKETNVMDTNGRRIPNLCYYWKDLEITGLNRVVTAVENSSQTQTSVNLLILFTVSFLSILIRPS